MVDPLGEFIRLLDTRDDVDNDWWTTMITVLGHLKPPYWQIAIEFFQQIQNDHHVGDEMREWADNVLMPFYDNWANDPNAIHEPIPPPRIVGED